MKQMNFYFLPATLFCCLIFSCGQKSSEKSGSGAKTTSAEVINGDTVNRTDANGWKQGRWVPSGLNSLKEPAFYRNDTLVK
jgi:hypothetical protein